MKGLLIFIGIVLLFFLVEVLASCNPSRKAHLFANSNPREFADFCATNFPARDSTFVKDSTSFDTLYLERPPVIETTYLSDTVFKTVYFPGSTQFITKTVRKDSVIIRVDNAAVQAQVNKVNDLIVVNKDLISQRDKQKKTKKTFMWWTGGLGLAWIIYLLLSYFLGRLSKAKKIIQAV